MAFFKAFRWLCGYILIPLPFFFGCSVCRCLFFRFRFLLLPLRLS